MRRRDFISLLGSAAARRRGRWRRALSSDGVSFDLAFAAQQTLANRQGLREAG